MDPSPKSAPILSFVMSRFSSKPQSADHDGFDPEQPQPQMRRDHSPPRFSVELVERMPHLADPAVLAAMKSAVAEVYETRAVLSSLGAPPDHEAVDLSRARIAEIDAALAARLEGGPQAEAEREARAQAEAEKAPFRAVIQLEEMHELYSNLLKEAEEKLVGIYEGHDPAAPRAGEGADDDQVNEEVISILREASEGSVRKVELPGRQLRFLPEAFGKMKGLLSLDLSNNLLEIIPDSLGGLEQLEELRLSSNLLVALPDSIGLLLNLKILDVANNKLKSLPDSISNCRSLIELDVSYNDLTFLPTNIGHELANLQKLSCQLNKLRSLPSSICEMTSLRFLDAHFNELRGVPFAIGKLSNLETLNLSSNFTDLRELPPSFGDLINLRELDLSNNQIHALPDRFGRLDNLTELNLDQNPLTLPPMHVVNQGVEAVKDYMGKRYLEILILEQQKKLTLEEPAKTGWLARSTSVLGGLVSGVSEYLGGGDKSPRDPYLEQNL